MRTIKFRIWDKQYQKWIDNTAFPHCFSEWYICPFSGDVAEFVQAMDGDMSDGIYTKNDLNQMCWMDLGTSVWKRMDEPRFVKQQFTGLFDKNGKKIFEGDLINFSCDYTVDCGDPDIIKWENLEVYYDEFYAGFYFGREQSFQMLDQIMRETLEVVGNIFERPDEKV